MVIIMKKFINEYANVIILSVISAALGGVVGALDAFFGRVLLGITDFRQEHYAFLIPLLALGGIVTVFLYSRFGRDSEKGMALVLDCANGSENEIPAVLIPLITATTWLTHLVGGSAGREGVAVQIGGAFFYQAGKRIKIENARQILVIAGMAAGFSGLFQTPLAATVFALEVSVSGKIKYKALLPALSAALSAYGVSRLCGLEKFAVAVNGDIALNTAAVLKAVALGAIFGIIGGCFAWLLKKSKAFFGEKIKNAFMRAVVIGVPLSVMLLVLFKGRYAGLGTNLISGVFGSQKIYVFDFALKILFTVLTLSAGFQGGEVTPLFSIGATLGAVLAPIFGLPAQLCGALGYAAVFGGATNTFFAPVLIGCEVFGYDILPFMFIACGVGYVFNGGRCIYSSQRAIKHI